jgi:hypothetical protein
MSRALRSAGLSVNATMPSLASASAVCRTDCLVRPIVRATCATVAGPWSMTPSTCQRALVSPAGRVSASPAASSRPFTRNTSTSTSENAHPPGLSSVTGDKLPH